MSRRALLVTAALLLGACSDDPTNPGPPDAGAVLYRLATVNGAPLPYLSLPCFCGEVSVIRSELVLRDDGTFGLGVGGRGFAPFVGGTYVASGSELALTVPSADPATPPTRLSASVRSDSIVLMSAGPLDSLRYVYTRAPLPTAPLAAGDYRLAMVNGRGEPLSVTVTIDGAEVLTRVHFDSLSFDGFFYRRHRSEETSHGGGSSGMRWITHGSYESTPGGVMLRPYTSFSWELARDSLVLGDRELIRSRGAGSIREERYRLMY